MLAVSSPVLLAAGLQRMTLLLDSTPPKQLVAK